MAAEGPYGDVMKGGPCGGPDTTGLWNAAGLRKQRMAEEETKEIHRMQSTRKNSTHAFHILQHHGSPIWELHCGFALCLPNPCHSGRGFNAIRSRPAV